MIPDQPDNIRVYVPIDLNKDSILRRLGGIIHTYGSVSEKNETSYDIAVMKLMNQVEIYDQVMAARAGEGGHSKEGTTLVSEIVERLRVIPDDCAETFPFELIDELEHEYGIGGV